MPKRNADSVSDLRSELENLISEYGMEVTPQGTLRGSAKFDGEPDYILYYYDRMMISDADEEGETPDGEYFAAFFLRPDEKEAFDIDYDYDVLVLYTTSDGFIEHELGTMEDWKAFEERLEAHYDED